jgi:hypothetical protein
MEEEDTGAVSNRASTVRRPSRQLTPITSTQTPSAAKFDPRSRPCRRRALHFQTGIWSFAVAIVGLACVKVGECFPHGAGSVAPPHFAYPGVAARHGES